MSLDLRPEEVLGWSSGLAMLALALLVSRVRPVGRVGVGFALFAASVGLATFVGKVLTDDDPLHVASRWVSALLLPVALVGAGILAVSFPRRLGSDPRWPLLVGVAAGLSLSLALVLVIVLAPSTLLDPLSRGGDVAARARLTSAWAFRGVDVALLLVFALRYPYLPPDVRRGVALVSAGLALYPASVAGRALVGAYFVPAEGVSVVLASLLIVALFGWAAIWLTHAARLEGEARAARAVAWIGLGAIVAGTLVPFLARQGLTMLVEVVSDLARFGAVVLWGFAIVRHKALGVDAKLRFALSKSTIAAVFVTVFFVASEAAQQFFGDQFQSGYLGILAAGALVFAFAPLSRLADRLAEKAVPSPSDSASSSLPRVAAAVPILDHALPRAAAAGGPRAHDAYRRAVRLALRDRRLTAHEELELAHVADGLGLSAAEATQLRHEVEQEARAKGAP